MKLNRRLMAAILAPGVLAAAAGPALGAEATGADSWAWTITPYLWLPTINGDLRFDLPADSGGSSVSSEIGPSDYLTDLHGALMLAAELRRDEWAVSGDLVWLDLTADASTVRTVVGDGGTIVIPRETNVDTETELSGIAFTLVASRQIGGDDSARIEALGGVRYLTIDADLNWELTSTITGPGFTFDSEGRVSSDDDVYDVILGLRGKWRFGAGEHWYVPWYVDVGAGTSDLTWQALAGVGYTFTRSSVFFAWRHLDYDQDDDDLLSEISFGGPGIGFSWRF